MGDLIGQTLGDYRIDSVAGSGGMGAVYRAWQISLNRPVAIKVLAPHMAANPTYIERFRREASAAAALSHQNIVHVYAAGSSDDLHYFVMEYVEGETISARLEREGRIAPDEALAIAVYVAQALDYAWQRAQLIHRDIKPDNIFISIAGEVKLGDLGLAKSAGGETEGTALTQHGMTVGTPYYCSPEQARADQQIDFRADIYSLGCTLYHMISGQRPYDGGPQDTAMSLMAKQIHDPPPRILQVLPTCPVPVVLLLNKMLAKNASGRHQSYQELIADLTHVLEKLQQPARPAAATPSAPAAAVRKEIPPVMIYAGVAAAVVLVVGLMIWSPWKGREAPGSAGVPPAEKQSEEPKEKQETPAVAKTAAEPSAEAVVQQPPTAKPEESVAAVERSGGAVAESSSSADKMSALPTPAAAPSVTPVDDAFIAAVAALPPREQVERVLAKLRELNPGCDLSKTDADNIRDGKVLGLTLPTVGVKDITPLKALPELTSLKLQGTSTRGPLADLSPLKGMKLSRLWCYFTEVADLSPLRDMPLEEVYCDRTRVTDLSPLKDMPLKDLRCDFEKDRDADILFAIKTLKSINYEKTDEFWQRVGAPEDPFVKLVAALPAEQQVVKVIAKLKELNPGFDGRETHKIEGGAVAELSFSTAAVKDIAPVKALKKLKRLMVTPWPPAQRGLLADLSSLEGLPLTTLHCYNNPISNLTPLKEMPLTTLACGGTQVTDLQPLAGMKLTVLSVNDCAVSDLRVLEGMPLTVLWGNNTKVADLSALKGMLLQELRCDQLLAVQHAETLRAIRTLAKINDQAASAFWMRVGPIAPASGRTVPAQTAARKVPAPAAQPSTLTAPAVTLSSRDQIRRFVEEMKKHNPGFDETAAKLSYKREGSKVLELTFGTEEVTDISPVKSFRSLKKLTCIGPHEGPWWRPNMPRGKLTDISPVAGLPLEELNCENNQITDLSPLNGMKLTRLYLSVNMADDLSVLAGMPLKDLGFRYTSVRDLSPLKGMKLDWLSFEGAQVTDLTPLAGMALRGLDCSCRGIKDLSAIKGMKLEKLSCAGAQTSDWSLLRGMPLHTLRVHGSNITDLSILKGMQLKELTCYSTEVADLTPLKGMPIAKLYCNKTKVTDLSPLKGMPLQELGCDFVPDRDKKILRSIRSLEKINQLSAAEFWKQVDAGGAPQVE